MITLNCIRTSAVDVAPPVAIAREPVRRRADFRAPESEVTIRAGNAWLQLYWRFGRPVESSTRIRSTSLCGEETSGRATRLGRAEAFEHQHPPTLPSVNATNFVIRVSADSFARR